MRYRGVGPPRPVLIGVAALLVITTLGLLYFESEKTVDQSRLMFSDVSRQVGIDYRGRTFGAAWRDVDGDGFQDLTFSRHGVSSTGIGKGFDPQPSALLLMNEHGEHFTEVGRQAFGIVPGDWHRPGWADYDNDGDADVLFSRGGGSGTAKTGDLSDAKRRAMENLLYQNVGQGFFDEVGVKTGVALARQRGRRPVWADVDLDGRLDLLLTQLSPDGPNDVLYMQDDGAFRPCTDALPGLTRQSNFTGAALFRGFADDARYLVISPKYPLYRHRAPEGGCRFEPLPFFEGTPKHQFMPHDFVLADLDGDLALDLFGVAPCNGKPNLVVTEDAIHWRLPGAAVGELRFRLPSSQGRLTIRPPSGSDGRVKAGAKNAVRLGRSGAPATKDMLRLSADDPLFHGRMPDASAPGIFVHYEPESEEWVVRVLKDRPRRAALLFQNMDNFELVAAPAYDRSCSEPPKQFLFTQGTSGWVDATSAFFDKGSGGSCVSAVAGDFDNDGDLDLYLGCEAAGAGIANVLLENRNRRFEPVDGGAATASAQGTIDSVSTGDYDNDGRLDLFVTAGLGLLADAAGPVRLLRNTGESGAWVRLRLVGTNSNRDAYGARVFLTADGKTQLRFLSGAGRPTAADEPVVHFGLGQAASVEQLLVAWPDGFLEQFAPPTVNRIAELVEGLGDPVTIPRLMTARESVQQNQPVRVLLLMPPEYAAMPIVWKLDGELLHSTEAVLHLRLDPGRHRIVATEQLPAPRWISHLDLTVD